MVAGNGSHGRSVVPGLLALSIVLFVCMIGAHLFNTKSGGDAGADAEHSATDLLDPEPYRSSILVLLRSMKPNLLV